MTLFVNYLKLCYFYKVLSSTTFFPTIEPIELSNHRSRGSLMTSRGSPKTSALISLLSALISVYSENEKQRQSFIK